jgi:hypothetical protein
MAWVKEAEVVFDYGIRKRSEEQLQYTEAATGWLHDRLNIQVSVPFNGLVCKT